MNYDIADAMWARMAAEYKSKIESIIVLVT
jgi:hypothetical protein